MNNITDDQLFQFYTTFIEFTFIVSRTSLEDVIEELNDRDMYINEEVAEKALHFAKDTLDYM